MTIGGCNVGAILYIGLIIWVLLVLVNHGPTPPEWTWLIPKNRRKDDEVSKL